MEVLFDEQDAPEGKVLLVVSAKGDDKTICLKCYYCKRGSFPTLKLHEFLALLQKVPAIKAKFLDVRIKEPHFFRFT